MPIGFDLQFFPFLYSTTNLSSYCNFLFLICSQKSGYFSVFEEDSFQNSKKSIYSVLTFLWILKISQFDYLDVILFVFSASIHCQAFRFTCSITVFLNFISNQDQTFLILCWQYHSFLPINIEFCNIKYFQCPKVLTNQNSFFSETNLQLMYQPTQKG